MAVSLGSWQVSVKPLLNPGPSDGQFLHINGNYSSPLSAS